MTEPASAKTRDVNPRKARKVQRERFMRARFGSTAYGRQLKKIADTIGSIVEGMAPDGDVEDFGALQRALEQYADVLRPWARKAAATMLHDVGSRDAKAWFSAGKEIGMALGKEIQSAPTGQMTKELLDLQVDLITSLPRDAARRVHKLTLEGMTGSKRAAEISEEILRSGHVSRSRAMLIARTETARTAFAMTKARAVHLGSKGYIWRTSKDSDVRHSHKQMEGTYIEWDAPPTLSDGTTTHAGCIYNCRCWAEPVLPDEI